LRFTIAAAICCSINSEIVTNIAGITAANETHIGFSSTNSGINHPLFGEVGCSQIYHESILFKFNFIHYMCYTLKSFGTQSLGVSSPIQLSKAVTAMIAIGTAKSLTICRHLDGKNDFVLNTLNITDNT
jgi:hypothetical protein